MAQRVESGGMRVFTVVWLGQCVSVLGSGLTSFVLGLWVYQTTGSVTKYALITLFATLPFIIVSPLVGALVDRWDRRLIMIGSDTGAAFSTLVIAILLMTSRLEIWHIYLMAAINATLSAFQQPALSAAIPFIVSKEHLGRANGMLEAGRAAGMLFSPMLAGILVGTLKIHSVILIDFVTFLFAVTTLLIIRIPRLETMTRDEEKSSLLREAAYGWRYLFSRSGLFGMVLVFAVGNFLVGYVSVLAMPMSLGFTSPAVFGTMMFIAGSGMLVGSIVLSTWGGPKRRMHGVYAFELLFGLSIMLAGLRPSVLLCTIAAFLFFFCLPIMNGLIQTIFQSKIAFDVQGRVFALQQMIGGSMAPLSYLTAGPLADYVFEPLVTIDGPLAGSVGQIIGTGSGRGIGLLFIVAGALFCLLTIISYLYPRIRFLEDELPDAIAGEVQA